jgi:hypothetical protein
MEVNISRTALDAETVSSAPVGDAPTTGCLISGLIVDFMADT